MSIKKWYRCAKIDIMGIYKMKGGQHMDFRAGGRNIQRIRKQRGLTQEQLAEAIGVTSNTVSRLECGALYPALDTVIALCNALNTNADSILAQYIQADSGLRWTHLSDKLSALPAAKQDKIEIILECLIETI